MQVMEGMGREIIEMKLVVIVRNMDCDQEFLIIFRTSFLFLVTFLLNVPHDSVTVFVLCVFFSWIAPKFQITKLMTSSLG